MAITEISVSKIYVLATEPTNKVKDRFWFDTTNNLLKRYDGTKWSPISVNTDDVKAVYPDHSTTTLSDYLSTLTSAVGDLNSNKQDKLKYYSEFGDEGDGQSHTSNFNAYNINIGVAQQQGYIKLDGYEITANGAFTGTAVSTSIPAIASASDTKLASEKAIATAIDTKQNNLVYYHENVSANQTALINGAKSFVIEGTVKGLVINSGYGGITIDSNVFSEGEAVISIANNSWMNHSDPILFDIDGDTIKISDALLIPEIKNKQNSTDNSLNTTDKTIVGAINELLASINANVITSTEQKRITTTSTASGIQMSTTAKVCVVSINPVTTNVGAIYISTSSDTAPTINPLYPDQMPKYKFPDASQVYIWSDVNGDSVDLTIEYYG